MPYGINSNKGGGLLREKVVELQNNLEIIPKGPSNNIIETYIDSYLRLRGNGINLNPNFAFSCLFDLIVSAKYADRLVSDDGWTYCEGRDNESPCLYFPYMGTCPRCSVRHNERYSVNSNKPGSDPIGDISGDTTYQIIRYVMNHNSPSAKIGKSSNRQGDVDFVIYRDDVLALGETKSSPLVLYPLEIELNRRLTQVHEGVSTDKQNHTAATRDIYNSEMSMYIPHRNERIKLGSYSNNWPYESINSFVDKPANVQFLVNSWVELFRVYKDNPYGDSDRRRWAMCGCGGGVDDSKNKPGMDRTDDIKKGTYQALKFGTYFKEESSSRDVRAFIATNLFPLRTFKRYIAKMTEVIWTKEKYSEEIDSEEFDDLVSFREGNLFNLYDAIVGFTKSVYMDEDIEEITSIEEFTQTI